MSDRTSVYLAAIKHYTPQGLWPAEVPKCEWRGSVEDTWQHHVGINRAKEVLEKLAVATAKDKKKKDPDKYFGNFVYMWEFDILGRVYHKVGITHDVQQRFKAFRSTIPDTVMSRCEIVRLTPIRHRPIALQRETAFIIAARDYWIGGEWFEFPKS